MEGDSQVDVWGEWMRMGEEEKRLHWHVQPACDATIEYTVEIQQWVQEGGG